MTIVTTCMIKPPLGKKAGGFTLVELMVALTIGLFLVIGLISLLVSTSQTRTELDKTSRQIENGRYALQLLTTDLQHAGFLGSYTPTSATSTAPDPCAPAGTDFVATPAVSVPVFIYGYAAATADATPPSCITTASPAFRLAGTHILVVRRVSTTAIPTGSAVAGETYMQVAACAPLAPPFVVGTGAFSLKQKDCATDAFLRKYIVRMYYVSSCNNCSPSDGIPTLKVAEFVNGAMTVRPLAEGIQNMEVDYGIDINSDGSPDCYVNNPGAATAPACAPAPYVWEPNVQNWANVVATRIHVLARNSEPSADWTDTRIYDLGTAGTYTPGTGDKYKRHIYSAVARVVNVASRREQP